MTEENATKAQVSATPHEGKSVDGSVPGEVARSAGTSPRVKVRELKRKQRECRHRWDMATETCLDCGTERWSAKWLDGYAWDWRQRPRQGRMLRRHGGRRKRAQLAAQLRADDRYDALMWSLDHFPRNQRSDRKTVVIPPQRWTEADRDRFMAALDKIGTMPILDMPLDMGSGLDESVALLVGVTDGKPAVLARIENIGRPKMPPLRELLIPMEPPAEPSFRMRLGVDALLRDLATFPKPVPKFKPVPQFIIDDPYHDDVFKQQHMGEFVQRHQRGCEDNRCEGCIDPKDRP